MECCKLTWVKCVLVFGYNVVCVMDVLHLHYSIFFRQITQVVDLFLFLVQFHITKEGNMIFMMYVCMSWEIQLNYRQSLDQVFTPFLFHCIWCYIPVIYVVLSMIKSCRAHMYRAYGECERQLSVAETGMAHPKVADEGDGVQICKVTQYWVSSWESWQEVVLPLWGWTMG